VCVCVCRYTACTEHDAKQREKRDKNDLLRYRVFAPVQFPYGTRACADFTTYLEEEYKIRRVRARRETTYSGRHGQAR